MQKFTGCDLCQQPFTVKNPPLYEPVNQHSFHQGCWEKTFRGQNVAVREWSWSECIFGANKYNPHEAHYGQCLKCFEWVRSNELRFKKEDLAQRQSINPRQCQRISVREGFYLIVLFVLHFLYRLFDFS